MNQVEVQIMGQSYILGCPPGAEERFHTAVRKVDAAMCSNLAFELSDFSAAPAEPVSSSHNLNNLLHRLDTALGQDGHLL